MNAPVGFRTRIDAAYLGEEAHRVRWRRSMGFLEGWRPSPDLLARGLDLGDRTPMTEMLEERFGFPFDSSAIDLDTERLSGRYGVVAAFEVLEHLFNPLHLLLEVRKVMAGPDARLFVSMPLAKPEVLRSPEHFHEMSRREALALFERAGFRVERSTEFRIRRPLFYLGGLKPLLRFFFERVQVYELATAEVRFEGSTAGVRFEGSAAEVRSAAGGREGEA